MKHFKIIIAFLFLTIAFCPSVFAIEGLKISVVSSNAILTWPTANVGETYLVQYRSNLMDSAWATIADFIPASGSNTTTFVDVSNIVQFPVWTGSTNEGTSGDPTPPGPGNINTNANYDSTNTLPPVFTGFYQVVRDGTYLIGVTNSMKWSDYIKIPVELGNAYGVAGTMSLTEDGLPIGDSIQPAGTSLLVDTTQITNGIHNVSLSTSWSDTNGNYIEANSQPIVVTVRNEISYPDWMPSYGELGNTVLFSAVSLHTNCSWRVDVYGSDYFYIGSLSGSTTDGNILCAWNLVDGHGVTHTNDTFFACIVNTFYDAGSGTSQVQPMTTASSSSYAPLTYKQNDPWLGVGKFAIAVQHAFDTITDHELLYDEMEGFTGAAHSSFGVLPAQTSSTPFAIPYRDANGNNGDPTAGWASFKTALYDPYVRNLVYFGHGGAIGLGYNTANTNTSILATEIAAVLHTIPAGQTNIHRFRFCFVDGCSTAKGIMPEAFGIIHKENVDFTHYYYASIRPSCYCGWTDTKSIAYINGSAINYGHVNFIAHIQEDMLLNSASINDAVFYSGNQSDVTSTFTTTSDFKILGYKDLTFGAYNN